LAILLLSILFVGVNVYDITELQTRLLNCTIIIGRGKKVESRPLETILVVQDRHLIILFMAWGSSLLYDVANIASLRLSVPHAQIKLFVPPK
jgi:hypothetical protein